MDLPGPALTAVGVAMIRATETGRTDRLYEDPWAQEFVTAAAPSVPTETWDRVRRLAEVMYESRTVGVRLVDDTLRTAVAEGCRQVVLLGAGLDTHAFRLAWPQPVDLFEVDLPELFTFKEPVLAGSSATCLRHLVAVDLTSDWAPALSAAGFRPGLPTCWVDHVSVSLPRSVALRLARQVTELSCAASRYTFPAVTADAMAKSAGSVAGAKELYRGTTPDDEQRGLGPDGIALLRSSGWTVDVHDFGAIAADYGRPGIGEGAANVVALRSRRSRATPSTASTPAAVASTSASTIRGG